MLHNFALSKI